MGRYAALKYVGWVLLVGMLACGDDSEEGQNVECPAGQSFNPIIGECTLRTDNAPPPPNNPQPPPDEGEDPAEPDPQPSPGEPTEPTEPDNPNPPPPGQDPCDMDGDGYRSIACGGDDCDDNDPFVNPGAVESCSFQDNNCDGTINSGLDCTFYAHSPSTLYRVDPFLKTAESLGPLPASLFDIDTHPNGVLYGITTTTLYKLEPGATQWQTVGSMGTIGNANGLCIDSEGKAYITASSSLYTVNLESAQSRLIGRFQPSFTSSGDCVINKADTLYMSARGFSSDSLILIDGENARTTNIGSTGFPEIYALTSAWGYLFGLTGEGHLITINTQTGRAEHLHTFPYTFYGAASTPGR